MTTPTDPAALDDHALAAWLATTAGERLLEVREEGLAGRELKDAGDRAAQDVLARLLAEHRPGTFSCAGCALPLFDAKTKFESGTGWPSFYQPLDNAVATMTDNQLGMARNEVHCRRCGGHLGHVFDDGPPPTGLRYCMNGLAITFAPSA